MAASISFGVGGLVFSSMRLVDDIAGNEYGGTDYYHCANRINDAQREKCRELLFLLINRFLERIF
jgi:hypothetical protein